MNKTCANCEKVQALEKFYFSTKGYSSWCKKCANKNQRKRDRSATRKQYKKENHLRIRYGISLDDYSSLLAEQNYCCAICDKPANKFKKALAVDHCHKTGRVRGLLCMVCNRLLGIYENNRQLYKDFESYLD